MFFAGSSKHSSSQKRNRNAAVEEIKSPKENKTKRLKMMSNKEKAEIAERDALGEIVF